MEKAVLQRIEHLLNNNKMSITELSKLIGVPQSTLNRQISGGSSMTLNTFCSILNYFKSVSSEWLMRGEGDMYKSENPAETPNSQLEFTVYVENGFLKVK